MEHLALINRLIGQPNGAERHDRQLLEEARAFHGHFQNPALAAFPSSQPDELRPILSALTAPMAVDLEVYLCKVVKILLRKESNRKSLGRLGMQLLVGALNRQLHCRTSAAAELGNVVINSCYDGDVNVRTFVDCNGLSALLQLLRTKDMDLLQSVLGALQGICFVPVGRQHVRQDFQAVQIMALQLSSPNPDVRARSLGCVHNLSADAVSLGLLREAGCLLPVVALLRDPSPELCRAAAGIVQNTAREEAARQQLEGAGATALLLDLLTSSDVECQAASVGAILNILSPTLPPEQLPRLRQALTDGIVMGVVDSCLFDPMPMSH
mmetsp:Transcript_19561/g.36447  ORF Transcript_19561/g.36447 Transcript_19561/m.36447 type:complete len:325 (+) Transcript_19561:146-1120(+)